MSCKDTKHLGADQAQQKEKPLNKEEWCTISRGKNDLGVELRFNYAQKE